MHVFNVLDQTAVFFHDTLEPSLFVTHLLCEAEKAVSHMGPVPGCCGHLSTSLPPGSVGSPAWAAPQAVGAVRAQARVGVGDSPLRVADDNSDILGRGWGSPLPSQKAQH